VTPVEDPAFAEGATPAFIGEVAFQFIEYLSYSLTSSLYVSLGLTLIPGPIVVEMVMRLM